MDEEVSELLSKRAKSKSHSEKRELISNTFIIDKSF